MQEEAGGKRRAGRRGEVTRKKKKEKDRGHQGETKNNKEYKGKAHIATHFREELYELVLFKRQWKENTKRTQKRGNKYKPESKSERQGKF